VENKYWTKKNEVKNHPMKKNVVKNHRKKKSSEITPNFSPRELEKEPVKKKR